MAQTPVLSGQHVCNAIMTYLSSITGPNDPQAKATPVGFSQLLLDPSNRAGTQMIPVDVGNGQRREVRILYKTRSTVADTTDTQTCGPGAAVPRLEERLTVTGYRQIAVDLPLDEVRLLCENAAILETLPIQSRAGTAPFQIVADMAQSIMLQLNGLRQAINLDLLTLAQPLVGTYQGSVDTVRTYNMLNANGSNNNGGISRFEQDYRRAEMVGRPLVAAFGNFDLMNRNLNYGCCNIDGIDFGALAATRPWTHYVDYQVEGVFGANEGLTVAPGVAQFVHYNENRGAFAGWHGTHYRGIMPDPALPGIAYDIRIVEETCPDAFTIIIGLHFDLFVAPENAYRATDRLNGVNGLFNFVAAQLP